MSFEIVERQDEPEQTVFDGMVMESTCIALKSVANLYYPGKLAYNQQVSGTWVGRVKGHMHVDGKLKNLVEILEVTVDEA